MKALIIVDVQNDFCTGGALAVPEGEKVIPIINKLRTKFNNIILTLDTHPEDHCSFEENGGTWPPHCIIGTEGQKLHKDLQIKDSYNIVIKGSNQNADSYSGFFDEGKLPTTLPKLIQNMRIDEVYICGLASEYCVFFTALDALKLDLKTIIIADACRPIRKKQEKQAFKDFIEYGGIVINSDGV